ncbi:MAG: HAD family phosphatase [Patescibacteria group bacterium]|nr:HAD family phosphatase [Patescibacteria group bacterium]
MKTSDKTKLAIFDIDGTIFRSSLLIELINGLVEFNVFPGIAKKEMEKDYVAWLDRKGSYEDYINKVIQIHLKYIKGCRQDAVEEVAAVVVKKMRDRLYRYTRDLIKELKKQDFLLISISGSPTYIVSKFAQALGFNAYFGSEYEIKGGLFTGRVLNADIFLDKRLVLKKYLDKHHIKADLQNSVAVGDTESDVSMLELVGRPIAFNPNNTLAMFAKSNGWEIVVERKDAIYELEEFKFINPKRILRETRKNQQLSADPDSIRKSGSE